MKTKLTVIFLALLLLAVLVLPACRRGRAASRDGAVSVLVFIPGVVAGSPTYEMMVAGALEFAGRNDGVQVRIYEAGFNQATWEEQLMGMVATGDFDLVLTTNPALPELAAAVSRVFPQQRFAITDAYYSGNPAIVTYMFAMYEQALFLGYLAGLITTSDMTHVNSARRIGFIAAQEFPMLTRQIVPGFIDGARRVDPSIELDFRVIGNWFDAGAAAQLANVMIDAGVDVFTSIAGGAAQGLLHTIRERGAYAVFFNTNEYDQAPGFVVGSGIMRQRELTYEILGNFIAGNIPFGTSVELGVPEGYVDFIFDDPGFRDHVPVYIQERLEAFVDGLRYGRLEFSVPPL